MNERASIEHLQASSLDELRRLAGFVCGQPVPAEALQDEQRLFSYLPQGYSADRYEALADLAACIRAQQHLRQGLARAHGFLAGFAEHAPAPLWIKDADGAYVMGGGLEYQEGSALDKPDVTKSMETTDEGKRHWLVHKFPISVNGESFTGGSAIDVTTEVEKERALIRHDNFYVLLSRLSALIPRSRTLEQLCLDACRLAAHQPSLDCAAISRKSDDGQLQLFASASREGQERHWRAGDAPPDWLAPDLAAHVLATGRVQSGSRKGHAIASCMAVPLFVNNQPWGVVTFYSRREHQFDAFYRERAGELSNELSYGIERLVNAQEMHRLARTNVLSGLPSRLQFEEEIAALAASDARGTVLLLNINRFDEISSAYGNAAAVGLMRTIAQRLRSAMAESMLLAHVGVGRFAIFLPAHGTQTAAEFVHETAAPMLQGSYQVKEHKIWCTISAGAAALPDDGTTADELLVKSWDALAAARDLDLRFGLYDRAADRVVARQISLEVELREALERHEFVNFYQPKIDLRTGKLTGAEALVRWRHPQRGLVSPAEFVPTLERTGLVIAVGRQVMQRAMQDWRNWHDAGLRPPQIAVNVAPAQFRCDSLFSDIEQALNTAGADQQPLSIEITESSLVSDHDRVVDILSKVRALDVPVAIDDFGTGYSSLSYLVSLPVDVMKIDRSFVTRMSQDAGYMGLVSTVVSLAHNLDLKVVAEGIETEEEAKLLKLLRCEQGQGYLYGHPVPADEFAALLETA
ncbi:putative bifunctional diguanylate cyclase/phosphodiesterase [Pseudoduganella violaceinigra]|uniref:putative bifunctional diguanylate cyclase/phosphodiesterase n=1 Tax=Pseudoduganella violaceinigra TaxID=246602 RepID=UPI0003FB5B5E|nr:EAL domain-containing protein [Pseudoduganella violaceinigra]